MAFYLLEKGASAPAQKRRRQPQNVRREIRRVQLTRYPAAASLSLSKPEKALAFSEHRPAAFGIPAVDSADLTGGDDQGVLLETFTSDTPGGDGVQDASFMRVGEGGKLEQGEVLRKLSGVHLSSGTKQKNGRRASNFIIFMNISAHFTA